MSRPQRIHYEGAVYHVVLRANNKEFIFKQDKYKNFYLKKVVKYIKKYGATLYAYAIMDNHAHLLIKVDQTPLSKIMQLTHQTFSQYYNKQENRTGHIFEERYKPELCTNDRYLLQCIRYIHQNPVKAGIADINYRWSSHRCYVEDDASLCNIYFPLSIFSDDPKTALKAYERFMEIML